jgi:potassium/hydrogen antiporter
MENVAAVIGANSLLTIFVTIIITGIVVSKISEIINIPDVVLYLIVGILIGPTLLDIVSIEKYPVENNVILIFGSAFILYQGGREVSLRILNSVKTTVILLSTIGVVISALVVQLITSTVFPIEPIFALLVGAVISSTDPATLIPIFNKVNIQNKVKQTIISESAFNDATGAILTAAVITIITSGKFSAMENAQELGIMLVVGMLVGILISLILSVLICDKPYGIFHEYAPIVSIIGVLASYELSRKFGGSGYMSTFIVGLICGNKNHFGINLRNEDSLAQTYVRETIGSICRMSIFILLGTQVNLVVLSQYWLESLVVTLVFIFIARPLSVLVCTIPDRGAKWDKKQILFMMWVRETGVIPAALSGIIVSMKIPGYEIVSSVVFMAILITLIVQGSTTKWVANKLGLLEEEVTKE